MNTGIPLQYFLVLATIMFFTGFMAFLHEEPYYHTNVSGTDTKLSEY